MKLLAALLCVTAIELASQEPHSPTNQPPSIQITSPTNGTAFVYSDVLVDISVSVAAFDPDGFLQKVRLELDGQLLTNSPAGHFTFPLWPPSSGEHQITAIATDEFGVSTTNSVSKQSGSYISGRVELHMARPLPRPTSRPRSPAGAFQQFFT